MEEWNITLNLPSGKKITKTVVADSEEEAKEKALDAAHDEITEDLAAPVTKNFYKKIDKIFKK